MLTVLLFLESLLSGKKKKKMGKYPSFDSKRRQKQGQKRERLHWPQGRGP